VVPRIPKFETYLENNNGKASPVGETGTRARFSAEQQGRITIRIKANPTQGTCSKEYNRNPGRMIRKG
jgi:hypothetical protein